MLAKTDIFKSGFWLTLPPMLFSLSLMEFGPSSLTPAQFNEGISIGLLNIESFARIVVFVMPAFISLGLSTPIQKRGLIFYLAGVTLYVLTYGIQNFLPDSAWSLSTFGFAASAYTNIVWMVGLGLLGENFYFTKHLRYRPIFYIGPAAFFVAIHTAHTVLYHQQML